jgi:WD40 repeat protein
MKIVLGTYEGNLAGWESNYHADPSGLSLHLVYAFNAHDGAIRAVSLDGSNGNILATGGVDECIKIYNLKQHREVGSLLEHKDMITCIVFYKGSHMISGSKDGAVLLWRCSDWVCLDSMRGHKAAINGIAIHPSGRIALTVAQDRSLRLWDLTKAKSAVRIALPEDGLVVKYNEEGTFFVVMLKKSLTVYDGSTGGHILNLVSPDSSNFLDMAVCHLPLRIDTKGKKRKVMDEEPSKRIEFIAVGCEGGDILLWSFDGKHHAVLKTNHVKRVRCLTFAESPIPLSKDEIATLPVHVAIDRSDALSRISKVGEAASQLLKIKTAGPYLISSDSESNVKLWDSQTLYNELVSSKSQQPPITSLEPALSLFPGTSLRPTCITASNYVARMKSSFPTSIEKTLDDVVAPALPSNVERELNQPKNEESFIKKKKAKVQFNVSST